MAERAAADGVTTVEAAVGDVPADLIDETLGDSTGLADEREGFQVLRLRTLDKDERQKLREDIRAEAQQTNKLSTWQVAKRLSKFATPHWKSLVFGFSLLVLQGLMDLAKPLPIAYSIDSLIGAEQSTFDLVIAIGGFVVGVSILEGLFSYLKTLVVNRAGRTMVRDMRAAMFDHVQKLSLQFHSRRRSGDLLMRVSSDVAALQTMFTDSLIEILNSVVFLVGMTAILIYLDWQLGLVALGSIPIIFIFVKRYSSEIRNFSSAQRRREGAMASLFHEALGSARLSRVFNREAAVKDKFETESAVSLELGMEASLKEARFTWSIEVLGAILTGTVLVLGVQRVQAGAMSVGELVLFFYYIRGFYRPIRTGVKNASRVWRSLAQAERVIELLDTEYGVVDNAKARPAPALAGEIEFRNVSFSYNEDEGFIKGVDLKIPAKRVTAVIGPTGAGKTTLVSMVPRLYDPMEGQVLIDGHDLRDFTLTSLRDQISVVLQESTLLYASVAENIAYGRLDADTAEIETAAWLAGAHDFIMDLPQGYATVVGERGETLSGGQRQLIAIARAIIRDAPIVILDEPMTGLDAGSSAQVREGLERLMTNKTVLFITHNLALVESVDNVIVIDGGAVVQQGKPHELRDRDGLFRQLFLAQFEESANAMAGAR